MKKTVLLKKQAFSKITILLLLFTFGIFTVSCSSDNDGFENANGNAAAKYVTKTTATGEDGSFIGVIEYDSEGKVTSASDGRSTRYFTYDNNGNLKKIAGGGNNFLTSEVMSEIYDAYEIGDILQYDNNGNPTVIELYDEDYYGDLIILNAVLTYDDKPFVYYYTLKAAGIIDVLYDIRFQFIAPKEIIMAKNLLPVNNLVKAVITNQNNQETGTITVNYDYDSDNYPISSSVLIEEDGYVEHYNVNYKYK